MVSADNVARGVLALERARKSTTEAATFGRTARVELTKQLAVHDERVTDDGDWGVRQEPGGFWVWWARWLGGVEQSGETYFSRQEAESAV